MPAVLVPSSFLLACPSSPDSCWLSVAGEEDVVVDPVRVRVVELRSFELELESETAFAGAVAVEPGVSVDVFDASIEESTSSAFSASASASAFALALALGFGVLRPSASAAWSATALFWPSAAATAGTGATGGIFGSGALESGRVSTLGPLLAAAATAAGFSGSEPGLNVILVVTGASVG